MPQPRPADRTRAPTVRIGCDMVAVGRFAALLEAQPDIADTLFGPVELSYCAGRRRRVEHLAARFAAKEAVLKALGTGLGTGMNWTDVQVTNDMHGRPGIRLDGAVARRAEALGVVEIDVSLSHVAEMALANAVCVCRPEPAGPAPEPTGTEAVCGSI